MDELVEKRKELRSLELQFNIAKLETRILEIDDEKQKIMETIEKQKMELMKNG